MSNRTIILLEDISGIGKKGEKVTNILLLLEDVIGLGKQGDLVKAKPGYTRNYLVPRLRRDQNSQEKTSLAVFATPSTVRKRAVLLKQRAERAERDKVEANDLASKLETYVLEVVKKVDPYGHMYGSITALDIAKALSENNFPIDRRMVLLPKPIKEVGEIKVNLRLKEDVPASFTLKVIPDGYIIPKGAEELVKPISENESTESSVDE
jgi:large subunit ribosomal protein L9